MYVSEASNAPRGKGTEVRVMMRHRIDTLLQRLADGAIWLLFKGNRVRS
jgi:hypothetical protein